MKTIVAIFISCCIGSNILAQSMAGITSQRDTSFTTRSAFLSAQKNYPDITIVEEFHSAAVKEQKNITYTKTGNRKLVLDAFYPSVKKNKRVAVIIVHGGGWRSGDRSQHYPMAQRLASLGYVCFTPEYRLSTEALYPAGVNDIKEAIVWVKSHAKKYNIDTNKVTVLGFSAGGQLAALTGTTNGNPLFETGNKKASADVQAIVDIDGTLSFVHPESGEGDDSKKTSAATYWFGYSKKENPALWTQASPLTYAGKNTVPTLFINSSVDRMHAGREDYIKRLTENAVYTEVQHFDNSPHAFCLFNPWFEPTIQYIDNFLKKIFPQ